MTAPRLLIVIHSYPDGGGIGSIVENFVLTLDGRYEIHLAIVDEQPGRKDRLRLADDRVHVLGHSAWRDPLLLPGSLLYTVRVGLQLRRLVRWLGPSAVVTQDGLNLSLPGAIATRGHESRLAVMDHGSLTNVHEREWRKMIARRASTRPKRLAIAAGLALDAPWRAVRWRIGARLADEAWYTGEELEGWFGRFGSKARRYAQIVPPDFEPPTPDQRARARARLGVAPDTAVFNVVSRLDGEKGLDLIVEAVDRVRAALPDMVVFVAGDGSLRGWLQREVGRRALDRWIVQVGRLNRDEVRELHHASDFHLYAGTISCGVSICLLEAMAAGVVPVVSDVPRLQRPLVGEAGWVFEAGDVDALTNALAAAVRTTAGERATLRSLARDQLGTLPDPPVRALLEELVASAGPLTMAQREGPKVAYARRERE